MTGESPVELSAGRLRFSMVPHASGPRMRLAANGLAAEMLEIGAAEAGLDLPTWQEVATGGDLVRLLSGATGAGYFSAVVALDAADETATIEAALRFKAPGVSPAFALALPGIASSQAAREFGDALSFGPWRIAPLAASNVRVAGVDSALVVVAPSTPPGTPPGTVCWGCRVCLAD